MPPEPRTRRRISFVAFYLLWAELQGWTPPLLHIRMCQWLETCAARVRVMMVFRGAAKSTLFALFKAWQLYNDPSHRSIVWSADDLLASKLTRDVLNVLRRHPLCEGMIGSRPGAFLFWVEGATDARNPSMHAVGVGSNATGSRADDADFDDAEIPKNVRNPEARQNLRSKMTESTHILVPGGRKTFIGTPHTVDSIYEEEIAGGAEALRIPLYEKVERYEASETERSFAIPWPLMDDGLTVIAGIGKAARVLEEGRDYHVAGGRVAFFSPPNVMLDVCTGNAWPERFTRPEVEYKRRECRTINEWDSQYQLHARPIEDSRLKPERLRLYAVEPEVREVNGTVVMHLGAVQVVSAVAYWDVSLGKLRSDASAFTLMLTDGNGNLYWHRAVGLTGELADFDDRGRLVGGQCLQIRDLVEQFQIPRVEVETNGPGGFVPPILRRALKGTGCGVGEVFNSADKRKRILDAFEPALSARFLWAHVSVAEGPAWAQLREFNPGVRDQPDDYVDSAAGAIVATPVRIGRVVAAGKPDGRAVESWRPNAGVFEAALEL